MVSPVRSLFRSMAEHRSELIGAGLLGAGASLSAVALLGTSGWLISRAAQMPPVLLLGVAAVLVRTFALGRAVFRYAERLVGHDAAFRGLTALRVAVYTQLERITPVGLARFGRGDLLARFASDVDSALDLPLRVLLPWGQAILVSAATVLFLGILLPSTGIVVGVLAVASLAAVPWIAARMARKADARMAEAKADLSAAVVQMIDATPDLAACVAAKSATGRVRELDDRLTRLNARESFALGLGSALGTVVQGIAVSVALALGVVAVMDGRIEPVFLAVVALLPLALFDILGTLPSSALAFQRLRASAVRIVAADDLSAVFAESANPVTLPGEFTGLTLRNVTVAWPTDGDEHPTLHDVSVVVRPGDRVAIVGPSGAGKSTLAAALMGFLPYDGSMRLSGVELRDAEGDDLRRQVGLLSQQAHLFDTSIAENLRLGDPEASDADLARALESAQLDRWVEGLPDGMQTEVGALGAAVSGGERQRLALTRLLLARRSVVILDEPTEHLDAATASALTQTLATALADATTIVITHRLSDLVDVDRIVELQDGRVTAQGAHAELLAAGGWYATQWAVESERQDMTRLLASLPIGIAVPGPAG